MKLAVYSKWEEKRDSSLLAMLDYHPSSEVIDLGCGDGKFSNKVKEKIGNETIVGVDLCINSLEKAEKKGLVVKKVDLDNTFPFKNNVFDVIVSNQVIEHLIYPVKFMKEVYRLLKPGGYALISTENLSSWDNIFALILGHTPFSMEFDCGLRKIGNPLSPHNNEVLENYVNSHVRIFTQHGLVELMEMLCFKVEKISGTGHIFGNLGEIIDSAHCRFITLKVRKVNGV